MGFTTPLPLTAGPQGEGKDPRELPGASGGGGEEQSCELCAELSVAVAGKGTHPTPAPSSLPANLRESIKATGRGPDVQLGQGERLRGRALTRDPG